jgi:hypothetical protein
MQKPEQQTGGGTIALECEAFLGGTLAEHWDEQGVVVPVWVWTNLLAHGTMEQIGETVAHPSRPRRAVRSWRIARSYLAHQILDLSGDESSLRDLQWSILVPLELEMAARPEVNQWTPRQWLDVVDYAIRNPHLAPEK